MIIIYYQSWLLLLIFANFAYTSRTKILTLFTQQMRHTGFRKGLIHLQDDLFRFAYKLTTDRDQAYDLLQETSLKALDNEDKYMSDTNLKSWLYTIMRNIFINNYHKIVRDQTFIDHTENHYHLNHWHDFERNSSEKQYDMKEMFYIVNTLPREYKIPFSMHMAGFKYREIAEKLNVPIGTIKSRIFSTRQKLQEELKDFR